MQREYVASMGEVFFVSIEAAESYHQYLQKTLQWLNTKKCGIDRRNGMNLSVTVEKVTHLYNEKMRCDEECVKIASGLYRKENQIFVFYQDWLQWECSITEKFDVKIRIKYQEYTESFLTQVVRKTLKRVSASQINRERLLFLTRIALHFPIFYILSSGEKYGVTHAAAVEKDGKGLVLAGYNGVGKSTLALYLCYHQDFKLITDNFLVYDSEGYIYPMIESSRVSEATAQLLGVLPTEAIYGRSELCVGGIATTRTQIRASALVLNHVAAQFMIREAEKSDVLIEMQAMDRYLPEFVDFSFFCATMDLLAGKKSKPLTSLQEFIGTVPVLELNKGALSEIELCAGRVMEYVL